MSTRHPKTSAAEAKKRPPNRPQPRIGAQPKPNRTPEIPQRASTPCDRCPWRRKNHGRRHPAGFYRKDNLRRLWGQIRRQDNGAMQSCHMTDPSHPDHVEYGGAREDARPQECIGSVILIQRELRRACLLGPTPQTNELTPEAAEAYLRRVRRGLTLTGFFAVALRMTHDYSSIGGNPRLPSVKLKQLDDPEYGLPAGIGPELKS